MKTIIHTLIVPLILFTGIITFNHNVNSVSQNMKPSQENLETATFAGGCFWCTESDFEKVNGVVEVISGYVGGPEKNPTYDQVSAGQTGHAEAVQVLYDPRKVTYDELLDVFWRHMDPTDAGGQFADRGKQYRSAIFYHSDEQKEVAEKSKKKWDESGKFDSPIVTEITPASTYYRAEDYHQEFFARNPGNPYCLYNIPPKLKKLGLLKETK